MRCMEPIWKLFKTDKPWLSLDWNFKCLLCLVSEYLYSLSSSQLENLHNQGWTWRCSILKTTLKTKYNMMACCTLRSSKMWLKLLDAAWVKLPCYCYLDQCLIKLVVCLIVVEDSAEADIKSDNMSSSQRSDRPASRTSRNESDNCLLDDDELTEQQIQVCVCYYYPTSECIDCYLYVFHLFTI